jgi:pilus assembly protein Flp/PilA
MNDRVKMLKAFISDDSGATAIEYGLIAAIVGLGIISSLTVMTSDLKLLFSRVSAGFSAS